MAAHGVDTGHQFFVEAKIFNYTARFFKATWPSRRNSINKCIDLSSKSLTSTHLEVIGRHVNFKIRKTSAFDLKDPFEATLTREMAEKDKFID